MVFQVLQEQLNVQVIVFSCLLEIFNEWFVGISDSSHDGLRYIRKRGQMALYNL